jgi:hypothetical protein
MTATSTPATSVITADETRPPRPPKKRPGHCRVCGLALATHDHQPDHGYDTFPVGVVPTRRRRS